MSAPDHRICPSCGAVNRVPAGRQLVSARCAKCKTPLTSTEPISISQDIALKLLDRDGGSFVFDIWAEWCGPCHQLVPRYAETAEHFKGAVRFFKVDADASPKIGQRLGVRGIPALFLFANGKQVSQKAGALPAQALVNWIQTDLISATNASIS